jgi:Zn-dependent protease with chaperone function
MSGFEASPQAGGAAPAGPARLSARWYDGRQARPREVELALEGEELLLHLPGEGVRRHARGKVGWPERTRHGVPQLLLPDGGVVELPDAQAWDAWARAQGLSETPAVRWARSWRAAVLATVAVVLLLAGGVQWGIPWVAERSAPLVPQAARAHLDRAVLEQLERRGWLMASQRPPGTAERLRARLDAMLVAAFPVPGERPRVHLEVRRLPGWAGPNAFALPGGSVVISDALLELLPEQGGDFHPGVLGVLAHEVGHVREHHGLRALLSSSATGVLLGWWVGDFSAVLATAPALLIQAGYSRGFEREADDEALRILRAAGVDPRGMVAFFAALKRAVPQRDGDSPSFGLASHPPDSERVRLFETGSR